MGIRVISVFVQKCLIMPFYLACRRPFTFGMACFSFLVYKKFPSFFGLVVSFSPVVICTFVFLEIILISSRTRSSEVEEEEKKIDCSSLDGRELRGKRAMFLSKEDDGKKRDFNVLDAMPSSSRRYGKEAHSEGIFEDHLVQSALKASKVSHHLNKACQEKGPSTTNDDDTLDSNAEDIDRVDASIQEVIPMLDELHPLLDTESTQPANVSDSYDSSIVESSHEHDSDGNDSDEEEPENLVNEEEEGAQEEKEREAEVVMKWTADDEKNLRDVGKIELERNQRLEHLIAKRRSRNYQISEPEKNLIDLDSNEPTNVVEELSRLLVMIPPRKNPFDLPCGSEENDLVPGSAPSVLLPRKNPFEVPCEPVMPNNDEVVSGDTSHHQDLSAFQSKDMFFKRYESFAIGESPVDYKQEKRRTKFRPYFVAERNDADETNFQHQLSSVSDSKVSSTVESESVSSISNHSNLAIYNDILEQEIHHVSGLISADNDGIQSTEHEGQSLEDDDENSDNSDNDGSTETEQEAHKENSINDGHVSVNAMNGIIYNSQTKPETKQRVIVVPHISNSKQKEVTEDESDETSTSSSSEDDQNSSSDSKDMDIDNENQIEKPLYDCSPSAMAKSLSNVTSIQDSLHYLERQGSDSNSSLASDLQVEISETGSPLRLNDQNSLSGEESSADLNGPWVASSNLSFFDMHESGTREVKEIREHDVIEVDFTVTDEGHNENSIASIVSETKGNTSTSSFPLMVTEESSNVGGGLSQSDEINKIVNANKSLRKLDNLVSHTSSRGHTSVDDRVPPSPPSNFGVIESQISILPPIPEEILEEFRYEEEKVTSNVFESGHLVKKENSLHETTEAPEGNLTAISSVLHTTNENSELVGGAHLDEFNNEASGSSTVKKKSEVSDSSSTSSSSSSSSDSD